MRHAVIAAASIVSLVAGFLIAPAAGIVAAPPANAGTTITFAEPNFEFRESYSDLTGVHVYSAEPTIFFDSYDVEEPPAGFPNYTFELEIATSAQAPPSIQKSIQATRNANTSTAEWKVPAGTLAFGESYVLRLRLSADGEHSEWFGWFQFTLTPPSAAPALISPAYGALSAKPAELVARIPEYAPNSSSFDTVLFTVEQGWENGAPTIVDQLSGSIDSDGVARVHFSPSTNAGSFRWSAQWVGAGYSEPSEYREFFISEKASPVSSLQAFPGPLSATLQWYVQSPVFAPVLYADITITPGNISRRVDAPATSAEFSDLPIGDYVASITVSNALGVSAPVTKSFKVTPTHAPAPRELRHEMTPLGVHLAWKLPTNDGGAPISHYRVQIRSYDGGTNTTLDTADLFADIVLATGFNYLVNVYAVNSRGQGVAATTRFAKVGVPGTPRNVEIRQGDGFVNVYWDAPEDDGGGSLISYRIDVSGLDSRVVEATYGRTGAQLDGIENGKPYTIAIRAINEGGAGEPAETRQILAISSDIDSDADGLPDVAEARFGTSSAIADTDGDGISDVDEALKLSAFLSPILADTDGNGVADGDEDSDVDGISNSAELIGGTNPSSPDTDHDSLSDLEELTGATNPLAADSDSDGVNDDAELQVGLDPNNPDTNGDGVNDSEEVASLTLRDVPQLAPQLSEYVEPGVDTAVVLGGVSAAVTGPAGTLKNFRLSSSPADDLVGSLTVIAEVSDQGSTSGLVGPQLAGLTDRTTAVGALSVVSELSFTYAKGVASARLQELAPVRWNNELAAWEFANNDVSVSTAEHTISILSPDLGVRYAIVDLRTWRAHISECDSGSTGRPQLNVEFVFDGMPSVLKGDSTRERFAAAASILDSLEPGDRATVREFGVEELLFNGGSAWLFNSNIESKLTDEDLFGLSSIERARTILEALELGSSRNLPQETFDWDPERVLAPSVPEASLDVNPYVESAVPVECRKTVVVFITDGEKGEPPFTNTPDQPFVNAGIPVHVLDLGIGSTASAVWLEELANATAGTYSYIPTQSDLTGWIRDVTPVEWPWWEDSTTDTDGDGLPDIVELYGVAATLTERGPGLPNRFYSDPNSADSDDDGIPDNVEIGQRLAIGTQGVQWTPKNINRSYWVVSDPGRTDSDLDGLDDRSEYDLSLNPLSADGDADGLTDSVEEMYGTFSNMYDTDSDGFSDLYEVMHEDDGFNPLVYNEKVSEYEWLSEAAVGFFCGEVDICARFTIPWLVGNIASGVLVFGDLRDGIALIAKGDFLAASLCAVGLIPGIGDALGASAKVLRFINKLTAPFGLRTASISGAGAVDDAIELSSRQAMQLLRRYKGNSKKFVEALAEIQPSIVASLRVNHKLSDAAIEKLVLKNGVLRLKLYAALRRVPDPDKGLLSQVKSYTYTAETLPRYLRTGKAGETAMARIINLPSDFRQTIKRIEIDGVLRGRFWDGSQDINGVPHIYEAKVGYVSSGFASFQIKKDAKYLAKNPGVVMEWHFYASELTGAIGPSPKLLNELTAAGIVVVFHMPGGAL